MLGNLFELTVSKPNNLFSIAKDVTSENRRYLKGRQLCTEVWSQAATAPLAGIDYCRCPMRQHAFAERIAAEPLPQVSAR
jgi:hypothetical protein